MDLMLILLLAVGLVMAGWYAFDEWQSGGG
jgi:hypothetical protein